MEGSTIAHNFNSSNEVKVTVTVVLNATYSWLDKPTKNILVTRVVTGIILTLMTVTAVAINVCLIITIFHNSSLKRVVLYQLVTAVSFACIADCVLNVPFSLYFVRTDIWSLELSLCRLNSVCVLLVALTISWSICSMCIERLSATFHIYPSSRCSKYFTRCICVIVCVLSGLAIVLPVAAGFAETHVFPMRLSCSVAADRGIFLTATILGLFCFPILLSTCALLAAFVRNFKDIKHLSVQRTDLSYAELFFEESNLWNEWRYSKFVSSIAVLYFILELPFILSLLKYHSSKQYYKNSSNFSVTPEIHLTSVLDNVYFWSKSLFSLAFPLVSFSLRRDIRRKFNAMITFCKVDSFISNPTTQSTSPNDDNSSEYLVPQAWRRRRLSSVTNLSTPIVFGHSKERNVQFQFTDLSSGIAKWKANYDLNENSSKRKLQRRGSTFFDDTFEDDEEFTEFMKYEDGTEEEINLSEEVTLFSKERNTSEEITIFTKERMRRPPSFNKQPRIEEEPKKDSWIVYLNAEAQSAPIEPLTSRLSKSFNTHRTSSVVVKQRNYYMTYPKLSQDKNLNSYKSTSELLKALKSYKSKNYRTVCEIFPKGTESLIDSPTENRNIVSL